MDAITSIPFWTITLVKKAKQVGWSSFIERLFLSASPFPKNSVVESWTVANTSFSFGFSLILWIVVRNLHCCFSLCPQTCLWLLQRRRRAFQVVFHEKGNASHECSVRGTGRLSFFSRNSPAIHSFEQYLEYTATAIAFSCSDC